MTSADNYSGLNALRIYVASVPCTKTLADGGFFDEKTFLPSKERIDEVREDIISGILEKTVSLEQAPHSRIVESVFYGERLIENVCAIFTEVTHGFLPARIEKGVIYFSRVLEFSGPLYNIAGTILLQKGFDGCKNLEYALVFECNKPNNRSIEHFARFFLSAPTGH